MATRRLTGSKGSPGRRPGNSRIAGILYKQYDRFVKIRGNPQEIALGFALGLFVGMTPTMGFQMVIAVALAAILKWNKISSALAVWVTNPLSAPFIYSLNYYVGSKLIALNTQAVAADIGHTGLSRLLHKAPEALLALFIGGAVLGLPLAVAGYYLSHAAILKYRNSIKEKLAEKKRLLAEKKKLIKQRLKHG